jgi:hypothetical protein
LPCPTPAWLPSFVAALQAVVADEPGLDCDDAAGILLLLDRLTAAGHCTLVLR